MEHTIRLETGRKLQVLERGDRKGFPIFYLHGTPGSRLMYEPVVRDANAKGIRLIGYDRPGYGGSTPVPGRRVGDTATEVAAIADHLGFERFGVWGVSGGGAPALACAAQLPKRVVAAASIAGLAPFRAEGLDFLAGMGELNVTEFRLMLNDRPAFAKLCRKERAEMLKVTPAGLRKAWASLLAPVDRAALTGSFAHFLVRSVAEGLKKSDVGMREDNISLIEPWGFELSSLRVPVQVWHGQEDRFVPFAHGQWIVARIPSVEPHLLEGEGHLSLFRHVPEVHSWLFSKS